MESGEMMMEEEMMESGEMMMEEDRPMEQW